MRIFRPREELRPYVRYYWELESNDPFCILTFPIGCPQMIFHNKTPLFIPELDKYQSIFTISGQVNFSAHLKSEGDLRMIVAVFYPHTIGMFIDVSPSAFYNLEISGFDIADKNLKEVALKILDSEDPGKWIEILEKWLLSRIKPSLNIRRIQHSLNSLLQDNTVQMSRLAYEACLGKRQFERVFRGTVGMNPKEYIRIVRFQKALLLMQRGEENYSGIAAECNFSDQSHFIREFRQLSGHTPKSLSQYCTPYSDLFTSPI